VTSFLQKVIENEIKNYDAEIVKMVLQKSTKLNLEES